MANKDDSKGPSEDDELSLVDDLGVKDFRRLIYGKHGKLWSTAGRSTPVAELSEDALIMHPPDKPFQEDAKIEDIKLKVDDKGILLDELDQRRKIKGAKFNGKELFVLGETKEGTTRHYIGVEGKDGKMKKLFLQENAITSDAAYKLRNKTHNGDLSNFPDLVAED